MSTKDDPHVIFHALLFFILCTSAVAVPMPQDSKLPHPYLTSAKRPFVALILSMLRKRLSNSGGTQSLSVKSFSPRSFLISLDSLV